MSNYVHPDVKTLEAIADNWWKDPTLNSRKSSRTNTPHDAQAITRLVSTSSLAVQDPYSDRVRRFVEWYRHDQKIDLKSMSTAKLEETLQKYQADIDHMFFLSLLTRKVEGPSGLNRLVRLIVMDGTHEDKLSGKYKREETSPTIRMWRINSSKGEQRPFDQLLYTLLHEMCHAYLELFSDVRHPKDKEWLTDFEGHGEMFWLAVNAAALWENSPSDFPGFRYDRVLSGHLAKVAEEARHHLFSDDSGTTVASDLVSYRLTVNSIGPDHYRAFYDTPRF
ncbi:hypothetical protein F4824DRAFT_498181 [Ustulina deusta]|nr:hypothetical protein F4824DRAFT_498181 [Ustulina deusta]